VQKNRANIESAPDCYFFRKLCSSNKKHWIKRYLKIIKDYKEEAVGISILLRSSKKVMSERPHLAFIEDMSS
jgi:hypothetical protein